MWLVVGLGNPGPDYEAHRHNVGFMVLDRLLRRFGAGSRSHKFASELSQADRNGQRIYLQKPLEYMNLSGQAVQRAMAFFRIPPDHVIVIHDEIDLALGTLRVKSGGGHGGHNGLRSISGAVGPDYGRVRCGVGRPGGTGGGKVPGKGDRVVGHVLSPFGKAERDEADVMIERAADAVEAILDHGYPYAMNRFNKNPEPAKA